MKHLNPFKLFKKKSTNVHSADDIPDMVDYSIYHMFFKDRNMIKFNQNEVNKIKSILNIKRHGYDPTALEFLYEKGKQKISFFMIAHEDEYYSFRLTEKGENIKKYLSAYYICDQFDQLTSILALVKEWFDNENGKINLVDYLSEHS